MLGLMGAGIAWLVAYYVTGGDAPLLRSIGSWNLVVGFGLLIGGFGLATQWR